MQTQLENFQHSGLLAFPKGNRTWPSWVCCARCQYVGAQSLFCLFIPEEPPPYFLMAFSCLWIQEEQDLVMPTLEQVNINAGVTEEAEQQLVVWRPSFNSVFNQLSCLLSGDGGEARILGALFLLTVAVVCEVQSRHLLSFRSPLFNHVGFPGITVFQNGIRLGARSFPGLWPSLRALDGGVGSYGTSQDSGQVLLFSPQEEMQNSTKHWLSLTLAVFPGQRKKVLPTYLLPCWLPQQRASHT